MSESPPLRPQILAPAGTPAALEAALAAGADCVYFGLDEGFNARARASNFPLAQLEATVEKIHRFGARAYLALNTLIFESELEAVCAILQEAERCQVDAIIVQDPALAELARRYFSGLEIHASTQMTISSPQACLFAKRLGCNQVVLPRELSLSEIEYCRAHTDLRIEVFIAGALCMAWSGQCLSSEAWGGRSANRGQCAQACRLPYDLVVDGQVRPLENLDYLLSPQDLAGYKAVQRLCQLGVHTLKIEGRQKDEDYVYQGTKAVRGWVEAALGGSGDHLAQELHELALAYSRGLSQGFFEGTNHQTLVRGDIPRHVGLRLGTIQNIRGRQFLIESCHRVPEGQTSLQTLESPSTAGMPELGMGVVIRQKGMTQEQEIGGAVFAAQAVGPQHYWLDLGARGPRINPSLRGATVYLTSDPQITKRNRQQIRRALSRPVTSATGVVDLVIEAQSGHPLTVAASRGSGRWSASSPSLLTAAKGAGLSESLLRDKLQFTADSGLTLGQLTYSATEPLFIPVGELKEVRRQLQAQILAEAVGADEHACDLEHRSSRTGTTSMAKPKPDESPTLLLKRLRTSLIQTVSATPLGGSGAGRESLGGSEAGWESLAGSGAGWESLAGSEAGWESLAGSGAGCPQLCVLCRNLEQLEAVIECGFKEVTLDWMELVGLTRAVERARQAGLRVGIATVRIQKPQEHGYDKRISALKPDSVLVRHWGALMEFSGAAQQNGPSSTQRPVLHGDFSLNVTNSITANLLLGLGLDTITAAHDLDRSQLTQMLEFVDPQRVEVVLHHHISTFHTEHCVYSHLLSNGTDYRSCGRPCEAHQVGLRDRKGITHPVVVDVGCRNTVFNGKAQSGVRLWPWLSASGIGRLRIEFVWEDRATAVSVLRAYQALFSGKTSADEVLDQIGAVEQFGVTLGTMKVIGGT